MKIKVCEYTKYGVKSTSAFDKNLKKVYKQGKDLEKLITIVTKLANGEQLDPKYKNHYLTNYSEYKKAQECHIEPD